VKFEIVAATCNKHKLEEFRSMTGGRDDVRIIGLMDLEGFKETVEDGATFEDNAKKKAAEASLFADLPAFADDSGLEIEALGGRPGVLSARYAGEGAPNEARIAKVLSEMKGVENRKARFVCVIAIAAKGEIIGTFRGEVNGVIIDEPRGSAGFGYDPIFQPDGYDKTFAELGPEVKDRISHRARALKKAVEFVDHELSSIEGFEF
jgi:XTP/dITP diphosphohydrolase